MIEMESIKLNKTEAIDLISSYTKVKEANVRVIIELLIKIGAMSEYVFEAEKKEGVNEKES